MITLSETDKLFLDEIQKDIPLVTRPFKEMGERLGIDEYTVIETIKNLKNQDYIRDISAIYNAKGLGYKSTLVALSSDSPDKTAEVINRNPGVSHNYYREYVFNVWFTLTVPEVLDFEEVIGTILEGESYNKYRILPSLKTFKIGVNFRFSGEKKKKSTNNYTSEINKVEIDRDLIRSLQEPFPLIAEPWKKIAVDLGKTEKNLFEEITTLKKAHVVKRISGILRHRKTGYDANGMACFQLEEKEIEKAGLKAAEYNAVSHCYQRPIYPDWPYSLFCMTHGTSKEECEGIISEIAQEIGALKTLTLYSTKEYKKERVKYFLEDIHV